MQGIIDFHTHAFPDEVAGAAIRALEKCGATAPLDGRVSSLLASMDEFGVEKSILCSIATKTAQFAPILDWSKKIRSERIIPFPSLHPDDPDFADHVRQIKDEGFSGIKLHPYYQDFILDEERYFPLYSRIVEEGLILVVHTGFDFAYKRKSKADPLKILRVLESFPALKIVTTHLGGWDDWEEVRRHLVGKNIYMEISFSIDALGKEAAREMILNHPPQYILFGTDSPWSEQGKVLSLLKSLELGEEREELILRNNALNLLQGS